MCNSERTDWLSLKINVESRFAIFTKHEQYVDLRGIKNKCVKGNREDIKEENAVYRLYFLGSKGNGYWFLS